MENETIEQSLLAAFRAAVEEAKKKYPILVVDELILHKLIKALAVAEKKHPVFAEDIRQGLNVIQEELGEVCQALNHHESEDRIDSESYDLIVTVWRFLRARMGWTTKKKQDNSETPPSPAPADSKMTRRKVLEEAMKCVLNDRNVSYGGPEESFQCIADFWTTYGRKRGWLSGAGKGITAYDVACLMSLMKLARMAGNTTYRDGPIDLAGYAACAAECMDKPYELREEDLPSTQHFKNGWSNPC